VVSDFITVLTKHAQAENVQLVLQINEATRTKTIKLCILSYVIVQFHLACRPTTSLRS